jgi:CheY-like chemotaxis protein
MSRTLLVADDSATMRQVVTMAFKGSPYRVVAVGGGAEALQAAYQHKPDVILLDYHLPDRSELEVCRALKGDPSLKHIPVLMMSGSYHAFDPREASESGSDDVILKPFRSQTVRDKVAKLTDSAAARPGRPAAVSPALATSQRDSATDVNVQAMSDAPTPPPAPPRPVVVPPRYSPPAATPEPMRPGLGAGASALPPVPQAPSSPSAPTPSAAARNAPEAPHGLDKDEVRQAIRTEVQRAVRREMLAMVRSVLGDLFSEKMLPKLLTYGEDRIDSIIEAKLAALVERKLAADQERDGDV